MTDTIDNHEATRALLKKMQQKGISGSHDERAGITCCVESVLIGPDGAVKDVRVKHNMIVNGGFDFLADAAFKSASRPAVMSHIAVGSASDATSSAGIALQTEITRKALTYSHTAGTKTFTAEVTFNPGEATGEITEAGIFNSSSVGTMLDRVVFAVINKGAADTLTQRFTFTMS